MNITKLAIIGIIISLIWFVFLNENYEPLNLSGEVFEHTETTRVNNVENIFYTPQGVALESSSKFIQISDATHPDLTERHIQLLRSQFMQTMSLKPLAGSSGRYFGMLQNKHPIYALEKNNVFIIYVITEGNDNNESSLRKQANQIINSLDNMTLNFN